MIVRKLNIRDVSKYELEMVELLRQSFKNSFPTRTSSKEELRSRIIQLKNYLEHNKAVVYGVIDSHHLLGFVWFFEREAPQETTVHINHFSIRDGCRGMGLGKKLLEKVEMYARHRGISKIELFVTKNNNQAVKFYQQRSFKVKRFVMVKELCPND